MKHIIDAIHRAAGDTVASATHELRTSAINDGWDRKAVKAVKVDYVDGEFVSKLSGKHRDAAFVHEFGDEENPPKATIRKASRKTPMTERAFLTNLESHLKGIL